MSRPSDRLTSENKEELSEFIPFEVLLEGWKMMRWHGKINGITVFTEDGFLEMNVRTLDDDWSPN